jgi:hypothetical protein
MTPDLDQPTLTRVLFPCKHKDCIAAHTLPAGATLREVLALREHCPERVPWTEAEREKWGSVTIQGVNLGVLEDQTLQKRKRCWLTNADERP